MIPQSENDFCSENQIRFTANRFRFGQEVWSDYPLRGRVVTPSAKHPSSPIVWNF